MYKLVIITEIIDTELMNSSEPHKAKVFSVPTKNIPRVVSPIKNVAKS